MSVRRQACPWVLLFALLLPGCAGSFGPKRPLHPTLNGKVMVGYQGWFRTPNDGSGMGWTHYGPGHGTRFGPDRLVIDYWPDVRELPAASRVNTPFRNADGTPAQVFSSQDPAVTDLHFRWMHDYGIDGAFVQRFAATLIFDDAASRARRKSNDQVLLHCLDAAKKHGVSVVVMYDLSGLRAGAMDRVMRDWRHLVDDLHVLRQPAYQFHRGKPLVAVWGVGFNDGRAYTLAECGQLISLLKQDPVDGGNTVMLGVPTGWRSQTRDATDDPSLLDVLRQADVISPWTPGRYSDLAGVDLHADWFWEGDRQWCLARGIDYLPVVFPGFSWRNLKGVDGGIDRDGGKFLWEQYRRLENAGFTMIYQAMFDEINEGTQILKTSPTPPPASRCLTYSPLPADYYLWLVGRAAQDLHEHHQVPETIPRYPARD